MAAMKDIVKLAVDGHRGSVEKYSVDKSQEVLREALIEANGGSTVLNYRNIRDGKCNGLFALVEELLSAIIVDDLQGDEFFNTMVDFRNVAEGDQNLFLVEDSTLFAVAEIARGTQGIRRQRHPGVNEVPIPTTTKAVRIYEELSRVLSGRVDFNKMINRVGISFRKSMLDEIYALWAGLTADDLGGTVYFPAAGSYDADTLLDVIAHVEAAAGGKPAKIVGTKKALRNLIEAVQSDEAKDELHNLGFYGKFYGTDCIALPQRHKFGTTEFVFDDDMLTIVATDERPIKFVYEGDPLVIMRDPIENADLTQEYFYSVRTGAGLVLAGNSGIGRYEMA